MGGMVAISKKGNNERGEEYVKSIFLFFVERNM